MAEYIGKEEVLKIVYDIKENKEIPKNYGTLLDIIRLVRNIPTADVVEVKHGEWIGVADYSNGNCIGYCSVCGTTHKAENASELKCFQRYCKWCGAKMDGGKAE